MKNIVLTIMLGVAMIGSAFAANCGCGHCPKAPEMGQRQGVHKHHRHGKHHMKRGHRQHGVDRKAHEGARPQFKPEAAKCAPLRGHQMTWGKQAPQRRGWNKGGQPRHAFKGNVWGKMMKGKAPQKRHAGFAKVRKGHKVFSFGPQHAGKAQKWGKRPQMKRDGFYMKGQRQCGKVQAPWMNRGRKHAGHRFAK